MINTIRLWNQYCIDENLQKELKSLKDQADIYDRFYKNLDFGTGGLRALMGVGSNRMNIYTVRQASQGIANTFQVLERKSVVIGYDSRKNSELFAMETAAVFAANNFLVHLFDELRPTPEVSFAVRELKCTIGIVITASHNPKEYNGYKVYGSDGGQITSILAQNFFENINKINPFFDVNFLNMDEFFATNKIHKLSKEFDEMYLKRIKELPYFDYENKHIGIMYSALHGAGYHLIPKVLADLNFKNIHLQHEQCIPNGNFPSVRLPNPEELDTLSLAIEEALSKDLDLVIATDPDCDRVGIAVKHKSSFIKLDGNQVGALILDYILKSEGIDLSKAAIVTTVVTSDLGKDIAKKHGVEVIETLTGFKYIGEKIGRFEKDKNFDFLFGFEESYGYLVGDFVRDKDAVSASAIIAKMASDYKLKGLTLIDMLEGIYSQFGQYNSYLINFEFSDTERKNIIDGIFKTFINFEYLDGYLTSVRAIENYRENVRYLRSDEIEIIELPKTDLIKIILDDGSWLAIRLSGTESKLKVYIMDKGNSKFRKTVEDLISQAIKV